MTQIIGPVVDVQLKSSVPAWRIPTPVRVAQSIRAGHVTVEVQHLLGGGIFRSVAMQGTQGLRRGDPAELLPGPISVPVGRCTLGRIFNVLGEPVDGKGPVVGDGPILDSRMLPTVKRRSIHRRGGKIGLFGGAGVGKTVFTALVLLVCSQVYTSSCIYLLAFNPEASAGWAWLRRVLAPHRPRTSAGFL